MLMRVAAGSQLRVVQRRQPSLGPSPIQSQFQFQPKLRAAACCLVRFSFAHRAPSEPNRNPPPPLRLRPLSEIRDDASSQTENHQAVKDPPDDSDALLLNV